MSIAHVLLGLLALLVLVMVVFYFAFPFKTVDFLLAMERSSVGLKKREINVGGMRIVYLDSEGDREPLILVHGFGGEKDNWNRVAKFLTPRYRVIALDLPGFGESDSPLDISYRVPDQVNRLHDFIAALGLKQKPHIAGHSMGGFISGSYAAKYPNEIASLWLVSSAGIFNSTQSELLGMVHEGQPNPLLPGTVQEVRDLLPFIMSKSPWLPGALIHVIAVRAIAANDLRTLQFAHVVTDSPHLDELLVGCQVPTHIVWGDEDRLVHVDCVKEFGRLLCNSSSTIIKGVGHVPPWEATQEVAEDYLAFRARLQNKPAHAAVA